MKFTVLIVTYHPDWKKLLVTLDSVMAQTFKDYEIVVSDDGSEENCFDKIEAYFTAYQFANYTLIPHEKNQGTVKNLIDGLAKAKGKYVRDFGPGMHSIMNIPCSRCMTLWKRISMSPVLG